MKRAKKSRKTGDRQTPGPTRWQIAAWGLLVGILVAAVMANGVGGEPVYDDFFEIAKNPHIRNFSPWWGPLLGGNVNPARPLPYLTFAIDHHLWHGAFSGFHVTNILIHAASAMLLFGVARRLLQLRPPAGCESQGAQCLLAFAIAALWGVHPLQTQAVTYVYQRMESLMGCFFLACLYLFLRAQHGKHPRLWLAGSVLAAFAAMGCKESALGLPLLVLALDRLFLSDSWKLLFSRRWGYYAGLALSWAVLPAYLLPQMAKYPELAGSPVSPLQYFLTQPGVILHYVKLAFWPANQCLDWAWPLARSWPAILLPLVLVGAAGAVSVWAAWKGRSTAWLGLWFFLTLAPTSSFLPVTDLANEHRMYLPLAAVIAAVVLLAWHVGRRAVLLQPGSAPFLTAAGFCFLAVALVSFSAATVQRNRIYESGEKMWADCARKVPGNSKAWEQLGYYALEAGDYEQCVTWSQKAFSLDPHNTVACSYLGSALLRLNRPDEAIACLEIGARQPNAPYAVVVPLVIALMQKDPPRAEEYFRRAMASSPEDFVALANNVANHLAQSGYCRLAIPLYEKALQVMPGNAIAAGNLREALRLERLRGSRPPATSR